jgi:hypothetical protein
VITPTDLILADTCKTIQVRDCHGRNLTVRRINAIDRLRLLKTAGPDLSQNDAWLNMAALTLSLMEIEGVPRPTPTNERQIEVLVTELGDDGLRAIADALNEEDKALSLFNGTPEGNVAGTSD